MIPQKFIEAYLRFLLNYKRTVLTVVGIITLFFCYSLKDIRINTDFFDFYPRQHPYIKIYHEFRRMFGSANVLQAAAEQAVSGRVVCFSTSEVFGQRAFRSSETDHTVLGAVGEARWTYAVSKLAEEHLALAYHQEQALPVLSLIHI